MTTVDDLSKQILADVVADFRAKNLGTSDLCKEYVGPSIVELEMKYCADGSHSKVDFDLALKQLEESEFVDTGPMVPYENTPDSQLFFMGLFSKREFVYLTEKGYKAAQKSTAKPRSTANGQQVDGDPDWRFARLAIDEARKSVPESDGRPHPKVGAVVVKDGKVLSTAHRGERPENHAEYIALEKKLADELVAGATVYTTLEPCTTRKHPKIPCAQRLVDRRVARVVMGMLDPNPEIRGLGDQLLSEANIETQLFPRDLRAQVEEMNREFIRDQKQRQLRKKAEEPTGERLARQQSPAITDPKVEAILSFKGKVVTVFNRQKYGHGFLEGYWANGGVVVDCTALWVTLQDPMTKDNQTFSLTKITVAFDNQHNRLLLELER